MSWWIRTRSLQITMKMLWSYGLYSFGRACGKKFERRLDLSVRLRVYHKIVSVVKDVIFLEIKTERKNNYRDNPDQTYEFRKTEVRYLKSGNVLLRLLSLL